MRTQAAEAGPAKAKKADGGDEELDPTKYFENRCGAAVGALSRPFGVPGVFSFFHVPLSYAESYPFRHYNVSFLCRCSISVVVFSVSSLCRFLLCRFSVSRACLTRKRHMKASL